MIRWIWAAARHFRESAAPHNAKLRRNPSGIAVGSGKTFHRVEVSRVEFVRQAGRKRMRVPQNNRVPWSLFRAIPIELAFGNTGERGRNKDGFVAVAVDPEEDVLAADVLVDAHVILIDVVGPGGKLEVVGEARLARSRVGIQTRAA